MVHQGRKINYTYFVAYHTNYKIESCIVEIPFMVNNPQTYEDFKTLLSIDLAHDNFAITNFNFLGKKEI